jgi:hypothetical protein
MQADNKCAAAKNEFCRAVGGPVWQLRKKSTSYPDVTSMHARRAYVYCEDEPGRRAAAKPSPATRPGASPPTSPSCPSWCVGPEHRATTRHSVISITLTAARRWQPPQRRAEGLLHCYLSPPRPRPRACRSAPVVGATRAQRLLFYVRRRGVCRWLGFC